MKLQLFYNLHCNVMHLFKNDGFSSVFTQFKLAPFMRLWFCLLLYEIQPREYSIFCMLHVW